MRPSARPVAWLTLCITILAACGSTAGSTDTPASSAPAAVAPSAAVPSSPTSSGGTSGSIPTALPSSGDLAPGVYRVPGPVAFDVSVADGWGVYAVHRTDVLLSHHDFQPPGLVMFSAWAIDAVYTDPCAHVLGPMIGPGVDALVDALRAVDAFGAGPATQVSIDGHPATHLTLELADDLDASACVNEEFAMWAFRGEETRYVPPGYRDAVDELWILEVDGSRMVLDGSLAAASDADRVELDAIIGSVRFPD